jgi:hypothetical protein
MLFVLVLACASPTPPVAAPAPQAAAAPAQTENLGASFELDPAKDLAADRLRTEADTWNGQELTVTGTIREVCQKKGCWHTLSTGDAETNIMVKDKEYAIFLPKDCAGRQVAVHGRFSVETLPLEEAKHLAADAGKDPATVTVAPKTLLLDASGVKFL